MTENNKKRTSSFRRIFPSIFFSHKSKEKQTVANSNKIQSSSKLTSECSTSKSNQYQNPRSMLERNDKSNPNTDENIERIYENLSVTSREPILNSHNQSLSNHSSSSTLVSEHLKNKLYLCNKLIPVPNNNEHLNHMARPQVPPKPYNELYSSPNRNKDRKNVVNTHYPDVYYHSLEKITDKITSVGDIEIYRDLQTLDANPASVGAEIKKVSTKFHISPKKEADVRTIQPIRARSLSLDKNEQSDVQENNYKVKNNNNIEKPYNYSAPTSPIAVSHKIPNMPTTVSPYEHVRKTMIEAEEKRNSVSRTSSRNKSTPSPRSKTPTLLKEKTTIDDANKEKTRQHVEAFYWHKIKELKQQEDEYLLRQAIKNANNPNVSITHSARSSPSSIKLDSRTGSLRREDKSYSSNRQIYPPSPFLRGAPERRTDSFITSRPSFADTDIIYRHPEKLFNTTNISNNMPIYPRGSLPQDFRHPNQHLKRIIIEQKTYPKVIVNTKESTDTYNRFNECNLNKFLIVQDESKCAKSAPLPPIRTTSAIGTGKIIVKNKNIHMLGSVCSGSESGSEAGEIQRIMQNSAVKEEDWHGDNRIDGGLSDGEASRGPTRGRTSRRDDPRRHTLAGNHLYMHQHHPGHINAMDIEHYGAARKAMNVPEYATVAKRRDMKATQMLDPRYRKPPLPRYPPSSNALLFDDDPGVMSEVETSSTGFRRGGKQRSSLPVVRTPSKTLERPLGLVFLQYRNETKRALLPNEITSIDTVKALFVRSFPKQLSMQYMDSPLVKIYIHDSSKDMFYELEDVRAHLRDIRDRSVLRLFESTDIGGGAFPGAVGVGSVTLPTTSSNCSSSNWDQDQSYFSEPEIDSDYHHQHVHKTKVKAPAYYMGGAAPSTLPRGGSHLRAYSPAALPLPTERVITVPPPGPSAPSKPVRSYIPGSGSERCFPFNAAECSRVNDQLYTLPAHAGDGYMSSPERVAPRAPYEDPYYSQFLGAAAARPPITPVIDEEANETVIIDDAYQMYGINPITTAPRPMPRPSYDARLGPQVDDMQRLRVEKMERQLANLTGLVQKALQVPGPSTPAAAPRQEYQNVAARPPPQDAVRFASNERPPKLGRDRFQKSVSFEKSVSFSDDPPDMNSPKQHSPQHSADTKPTKPAIKSSTLPRTSSQERDRLKPAPPPKPAGLVGQQMNMAPQKTSTINVNQDFFNQLNALQNQSRDLRIETRNLRHSTLSHAVQMREMMADTIVKIGAIAASFCREDPDSQLMREEEIYRQDMLLLENDLYELEATVERLRGQAANREIRVNMADIECIAIVLSKSSKTVADWKLKFPILQETMKTKLASEMEKVVRKEKMLEEEPERLELALRRCKKLTGTLVTLKRLACVQEQRLPINDGRDSPTSSQSSTITAGPSSEEYASEINACSTNQSANKGACGRAAVPGRGATDLRPENALDALLDELQTFSKPGERGERGDGPLRRLHSYPSGSDTDASPPVRARGQRPPKPPVPERHPELLALAARRAPPPPPPRTTSRSPLASPTSPTSPSSPPRTTSDHNDDTSSSRQALLEHRHQELLKKQKALQEQYARLQMIQRSGPTLPMNAQPDLKKTGSESNLLSKLNLNLAPANLSGSMTHLAGDCEKNKYEVSSESLVSQVKVSAAVATTNKVYETDIL